MTISPRQWWQPSARKCLIVNDIGIYWLCEPNRLTWQIQGKAWALSVNEVALALESGRPLDHILNVLREEGNLT